MINQRSSGLQALRSACQFVLVSALFWTMACVLVFSQLPAGDGQIFLRAYVCYNAVLLVGLLIEALGSRHLHRAGYSLIRVTLLSSHNRSLGQTLYA
ncbi:MAG: hypothetical protein JO117_04950, partial [Verrucomicrobia bacterium]|nr:hypothetical protein [Verrucomicrobiota bacterium]